MQFLLTLLGMKNTGKVLVCREQVKNLLFGSSRLLVVWGYECYPLLRLGLPAGSLLLCGTVASVCSYKISVLNLQEL